MRALASVLLAVVLALGCGSSPPPGAALPTASAPSAHGAAPDPIDRPLPLDPLIAKGKLDSGLTYYVLPHKKPKDRAQLWLVVNAGSVLEDGDQQGLAHFVEHMGFNGTRRFPKQELVDFFEKSGVRFGADLNAYTSFDETVYTLQVPTDVPGLVERGLAVLRDWADGMTFDAREVEQERGVVLEEWRLGRGAGKRIFDKQAPIVFHGSKYAERLPIGQREVIEHASRDALVRYYRDWYRPDLMALVVVGDVSRDEIESKIRAEFSTLSTPAKARPRPLVKLPPHAETLVSIETDPELRGASVSISSKLPHRPEASARDYRRTISEQLFHAMLNARLDEIRQRPDAPYVSAQSSSSGLVRSADVFRQSAQVKEGSIEAGFEALLTELLRVERHGFVATELERAKLQLLRYFEQAVKERETIHSRELAAEVVRNFLEQEAMPGRPAELELVRKFLPTIELGELNALAKTLAKGSRVITLTAPAHVKPPTRAALLGTEQRLAQTEIEPYRDLGAGAALMERPPTPGKIASEKTIPEIGVTEWTLENGVRVILKPTEFEADLVRMSAFSPGGTSLVPDADHTSARFADEVVGQGGLGAFDAIQLRKALAGKVAMASARIDELEEGMSGRAATEDLETLMQLVHLGFTAPRADAQAFAAWRARQIEQVKNRRLSPEGTFYEDLMVLETQNHLRRRPVTPELLGKIDLERALSIYRDRFADASDFTFVFVGKIDLARFRPLVETYLASLPVKRRKESWRDVKVRFPAGIRDKTVELGSEPKSRVVLTFHGPAKWSRETDNDMRMLVEALRMRLRRVLREDLGGVYGVSVSGSISRRPRQEYRLDVSFGCAPENVERLKKAVFDELSAVQTQGVEASDVEKLKAARRRAHQVALAENGFWLSELDRAYTFGDDPRLIPDAEPLIGAISSDRIRKAAKQYASSKQYVLGVLRPAAASGVSATR